MLVVFLLFCSTHTNTAAEIHWMNVRSFAKKVFGSTLRARTTTASEPDEDGRRNTTRPLETQQQQSRWEHNNKAVRNTTTTRLEAQWSR